MPTTIKTGWLKDHAGDKFAPKTLTSQVQTSDGTLLEDKIQADLNAAKAEVLEDVKVTIDNSLSSPDWNQNDPEAADYVKNRTHYGDYVFCSVEPTTFSPSNEKQYLRIENVNFSAKAKLAFFIKTDYNESFTRWENSPQSVQGVANGEVRFVCGHSWSHNGSTHRYEAKVYLEDSTESGLKNIVYELTNSCSDGNLICYAEYLLDTVKQLDEKFIPDAIARTAYVDENFALKSDLENIDLSAYETTENAVAKLDEAKAYTDSGVEAVRTEIAGKANYEHAHDDIYYTETEIDEKLEDAKAYVDVKMSGLASVDAVNTSISTHDTSTSAHEDIRALLNGVSDDEFLAWLNEADIIEPVTSPSGEIYTTNNNKIYIL